MKTDAKQRATLTHMETAHAETARHLAVIERQVEARAERMTTSNRVKARQFGRASATWSRADERDVQANVAALRCARRGEIDALSQLARQAGAIAAHCVLLPDARTGEEGTIVMMPRFPRTEALIPDELLAKLIENSRTSEERDGFDPFPVVKLFTPDGARDMAHHGSPVPKARTFACSACVTLAWAVPNSATLMLSAKSRTCAASSACRPSATSISRPNTGSAPTSSSRAMPG